MRAAPAPRKVRAWYGLAGEIQVEHGLWHLVRVGRISLPHPPLVNLFLRAPLGRETRLDLSFRHEFAHLQTLPLALLHVLSLRPWRLRSPWRLAAALAAHEAVWELAAEAWVVAEAPEAYRRAYGGRWHRPLLFAGLMAALAAAGSLVSLRPGERRSQGL